LAPVEVQVGHVHLPKRVRRRRERDDAAAGRLDFIDQQVARAAEGDRLVPLDSVLRDGA
jgi:hypothetical protein